MAGVGGAFQHRTCCVADVTHIAWQLESGDLSAAEEFLPLVDDDDLRRQSSASEPPSYSYSPVSGGVIRC